MNAAIERMSALLCPAALFFCTIIEWMAAIPKSHGTRLEFSTGSHAQ